MKGAPPARASESPRHIFGWVAAARARTVSGVALAQPFGTVLLAAGARLAAGAPRVVLMWTLNPLSPILLPTSPRLTRRRPGSLPPRFAPRWTRTLPAEE